MPDCIEFSSAPVSMEAPCFTSAECWAPSCTSVGSVMSQPVESSASRVSSTAGSLELNTHSLYGASVATAALDSHKSAGDLVQEGTFVQSQLAPRADQTERQAGEQSKVIVSNDATVTPDYIVRKDGQVEVVGNPDAGDKAHSVYRVQVEPGADPKATDALMNYLNDHIRQKDPGADLSLEAAEGLVSAEIANKFTAKPSNPDTPPEQDNPPAPEPSPNCPGGGGGGGDCPGGGGGDDQPQDNPQPSPQDNPNPNPDAPDSPPQPDAPSVASSSYDNLLEAAQLNSWDNNTNGSLGAYEVNAGTWFGSWLDDDMMEELGNPPDYRKLGKVLAKHKNDPKFKAGMAARLGNMREQGDAHGADTIEHLFDRLGDEHNSNFAENFGIFLNSQRPGGRNATGEEMNEFFNKDIQKAIASSRMADIAHDAHVKVADLAPEQAAKLVLSGALGHVPSDKEQSDYSKYMQTVVSKYKTNKPNG